MWSDHLVDFQHELSGGRRIGWEGRRVELHAGVTAALLAEQLDQQARRAIEYARASTNPGAALIWPTSRTTDTIISSVPWTGSASRSSVITALALAGSPFRCMRAIVARIDPVRYVGRP
jgi:hypothetical protein